MSGGLFGVLALFHCISSLLCDENLLETLPDVSYLTNLERCVRSL